MGMYCSHTCSTMVDDMRQDILITKGMLERLDCGGGAYHNKSDGLVMSS